MFKEIFSTTELFSSEDLNYWIDNLGCSLKLENQSPFAIDLYEGTTLTDRINPYSFSVIDNKQYQAKVNRDIKADIQQSYNFVSLKQVQGDTSQKSGSTTFTGTINVQGNVNISNSTIDVAVQNDLNATILNSVLNVEGNINIANTPTVNLGAGNEVNIANTPSVILAGTNTVNIGNTPAVTVEGTPTVQIAQNQNINIGTMPALQIASNQNINVGSMPALQIAQNQNINANIQNAQLNAEVINEKLATNSMVYLGKVTTPNAPIVAGSTYATFNFNSFEEGIYDTLVFRANAFYNDSTGQQTALNFTYKLLFGEQKFRSLSTLNAFSLGSQREYNIQIMLPGGGTKNTNYYAGINATLPIGEPLDFIQVELDFTNGAIPTGATNITFSVECWAYLNTDVQPSSSSNPMPEQNYLQLPTYTQMQNAPSVNVAENGNASFNIVPQGSYTTAKASPTLYNQSYKGVLLSLYVSAIGTGNLQLQIYAVTPSGLNPFILLTPTTMITAAGAYYVQCYPNGINGGSTQMANTNLYSVPVVLPDKFVIRVLKSDSSSWNFYLDATFLK